MAVVFSGFGNGLDQSIAVEGIDLIEGHNRDHQPVAHIRPGDGPSKPDDAIKVPGLRRGTQGLHQQTEVRRVAWNQDVGFQAFDGHHPAQLPHQVAVLRLGKHGVKRLPVREPGRLGPPRGLGKFLLHRKSREARFNPADGIDVAGGGGGSTVGGGRRSASRTRLGRERACRRSRGRGYWRRGVIPAG